MSNGSSLPYRLRQNKSVDRELFLGLLGRLAATLRLEDYQYVGLGGPFLEDFRLIHARLGLTDLVCIEEEENVHKRQLFNRPIDQITCVNSTLEDYLDETDIEKPVIIWFDYTDPKAITDQIERFAQSISTVPVNSIFRITLNANPASLGKPKPEELAVEIEGLKKTDETKPTLQEWRLERFKERFSDLSPSGIKPSQMTKKEYGACVLEVLNLAIAKEDLNFGDRKPIWALATHYADGQPMVTATLVICPEDVQPVKTLVENWEYHSTPSLPLMLDMPALSTLERLTMESCDDAKDRMGFELPKSDMGEDPLDSFRKFYRFFPHFSRVEL